MKALILWHEYDGGGRITNASSEMFYGTPLELHQRIMKAHEENIRTKKVDGTRIVPHQIIIF